MEEEEEEEFNGYETDEDVLAPGETTRKNND